VTELFEQVVGQDRAVAALKAAVHRPVHAYLLVGPAGTGKAAAAVSFAAALLCPTGGHHPPADASAPPNGPFAPPTSPSAPPTSPSASPTSPCETCRRVLAGLHPDVVSVEREGASIGIGQAREVIRSAYLSPVEGGRKVIILHDFHLVRDTGPALLKTLEEPPATTVFVVLAEYLPPELVTIASRCVTVDFAPLSAGQVVEALVATGVPEERARALAEASGGRLERARLLATDPRFEARRQAWWSIPSRLDGSGATNARIADELVALMDQSVAPLRERQQAEVDELTRRNARNAEVVGSGRAAKGRARATKAALNAGLADLEERHRREQRRQRTDELRAGLATLASAYRERLTTKSAPQSLSASQAIAAVACIDRTAKSLEFNPGELLALQALLARLASVARA
jgi:DNA polymerase III subunit delta'